MQAAKWDRCPPLSTTFRAGWKGNPRSPRRRVINLQCIRELRRRSSNHLRACFIVASAVLGRYQQPMQAGFSAQDELKGWIGAMNMRLEQATAERVVLAFDVGPEHLQPFGLVHGGVYCGAIETVCSIGASLAAGGAPVVGLENQTSFLRAVRSGTLTAVGTPQHVGRTSQLWVAEVRDAEGRLVASGRLRLLKPEQS